MGSQARVANAEQLPLASELPEQAGRDLHLTLARPLRFSIDSQAGVRAAMARLDPTSSLRDRLAVALSAFEIAQDELEHVRDAARPGCGPLPA